MVIIAKPGYIQDPSNPNGVIKAPATQMPGSITTPVLTARAADKDIATIQSQHADIINGMTMQAANTKAATEAKTATETQNKAAADKLAIDKQNADAKTAAVMGTATPGADVFGNQVADTGLGVVRANNGTYTGQDGKQYYKYDNTPVGTTPTGTLATGGTYQQQLDAKNAEYEQTAQKAITTIDNIQNGTIPLSPGEIAQIDGLKQQFNQLIEDQKLINKGATGTANIRGYQQGAAEYDPTFQTNKIASVISAGANKVADLNIKMASAVATLTQSFKDNNIKAVKDAWNIYQTAADQRIKTIQETIKTSQEAVKAAQEALQKKQEAEAKVTAELTKSKNDILLKLGTSGNQVSPEVIAAVQGATNVGEAIAAAGGLLYSADEKLDAQYKRLQMDKIKNDMALGWENLALDKAKALKDENGQVLDPAQTIAYAAEYAANGKIPTGLPKGTFGTVAQIAKEIPKSPGQVLSISTGVAPAGDDAYQSGLAALYSATELAKQLKVLDEERIGGIIGGVTGKIFGSDAQTKYMDLRSQIVDLLSRARSGAALTPAEEKRYSDMLPGRFSESLNLGADSDVKIDNFISNITNDAKNKASAKGWAINGVSDVKLGGNTYKVGDVIDVNGVKGRVNADGSITQL